MSPDSSEDENPSQPTVNGNQQEHTTSDHQDIPSSLQQRTIPEPPVTQPLTQPSAKDEQWKADQRENWIRQLRPQWALAWVSIGAVIAAVITLITATKNTLIAPSSHPF